MRDPIFLLIREKCPQEVSRCRGVHVGQNGQEFFLSTYPFKEYIPSSEDVAVVTLVQGTYLDPGFQANICSKMRH